jgi:gliding motility-associated-like protein
MNPKENIVEKVRGWIGCNFSQYRRLKMPGLAVVIYLGILTPVGLTAQKQANIWHFGDNCALDFSSGNPVNIQGSQMQTFEGSAAYCNSLGNFLFYTNGGGREPAFSGQNGGTVWDKTNAIMFDMLGTQGGGFSAAQSAVIFEAPGKNNTYYLFTMDELEYTIGASATTNASQPLGRGLRFFTIDMNLNGGKGAVVLANQSVYEPSAEGLCAVRHPNKQDYWILINQDSTGLGVYRVASSGVSFLAKYTAIGMGSGIIKASPDGSKVRSGSYLLDFNSSNGQLSNPVNLNSSTEFFEFSPNSRFLFELNSTSGNITLGRYDLQSASIPSSFKTISTISNAPASSPGQMQLGPDGKIYFLEADVSGSIMKMHRVSCPNTFSAAAQLNLFSYPGFFIGLPNFAAWLFEAYDSTFVSLGPDTVNLCDAGGSYTLDAMNPGASYLWSTGATTKSIVVTSPGMYSVTVTGPCGIATDQIVVEDCDKNYDSCTVYVPNAFTPNSDGINDLFSPFSNCGFDYFECSIYNRWGQLLFETSNQTKKWDGKYDGSDCSEGVYVYKINYKIPGKPVNIMSGSVTLVR